MTGTCGCGATWGGGKAEHCPAPGCHQTFSGTYSGDMHRVGRYDVTVGPNRRRCLSVEEMTARGMTKNKLGVWMSPSREAESARLSTSA